MILRQYKGNGQFLIGSKLVELRASDIQFIFGIICGNKKVSGLSCSKNKVKFARKKGLQRLDQQGIKHLISEELLKSNKKQDVQDVARLVCLFLCVTLFFTSSATLSWVYVKHMDDWNEMKNYDWGTAIKDLLIRSIEKNISDPWKVQGCAILLLVNEDELSPTSQEDLIYQMHIEQEEIGEEQEEEEEGEGEEEEEEQEQEEEEEEEEEVKHTKISLLRRRLRSTSNKFADQGKYIDEEEEEEQNEIEQELIFIEEEEDEEQESDEKKEQVKEEEDDENNEEVETKEMLEEGDSAEEGDSVGVEQVAEEGNGAVVEQVAEEVDAATVEEDEGDLVQKLSEEGGVENGNDSEMDDMFHTAETVDEQIKSTNQSASTFVAETQFSNQARDQTAVEDDVDFGARQTQAKKAIDELAEGLKKMQDDLEQGVSNLHDKCARLEEDNVILEAQNRALEVQNSELEKQTLLLSDSLWAGNHYETSIHADEASNILEQEAIANSYLEANGDDKTRWKMYNDDLHNVLLFDSIIFPIHEDDHWTLLVLDVLKGTWCFYDSMQQKRVTAYLEERWERFCIEPKVRIEPRCPQQPPRSDCGIIVCNIMKHFVLKEEVQDTISNENCNKIRAEILEAFITDEEGLWQSQ
ncbi:hypothetical protein RHMOL_Rhmol05G0232000 [Rhododendron molle]|uniref:Uncharacterized protein n=1 Tax=Rhododendron molle TaxID=49168 RepID=A0ACC0NSF3_RHOML|nr:hypothetical protein RHMOL_Rhmol05G0232000 [Rhododendron molle]